MNHPLSSLIREHQVISRLVEGLVGYAECLEQPGAAGADPSDLGCFARFFREFADELHHDKEENVLIPLLTRHGFTWEEGVLANVRRDHEHERYLIDVLCQASERHSAWNEEDRRSIAATATALANFQRGHLTLENEGLFPDVTRRLAGDALEQLHDELVKFDSLPRHRDARPELLGVAERLVQRYATRLAAPAGVGSQSVAQAPY